MAPRSPACRITHTGEDHLDAKSDRAWWWETLSPRFAEHHERFALPLSQRMQASMTAGPDVAVRTLGAAAIGALALPFGFPHRVVHRQIANRLVVPDPLLHDRLDVRIAVSKLILVVERNCDARGFVHSDIDLDA